MRIANNPKAMDTYNILFCRKLTYAIRDNTKSTAANTPLPKSNISAISLLKLNTSTLSTLRRIQSVHICASKCSRNENNNNRQKKKHRYQQFHVTIYSIRYKDLLFPLAILKQTLHPKTNLQAWKIIFPIFLDNTTLGTPLFP